MKFTEKTRLMFACIAAAVLITACTQAPKSADTKSPDPKTVDPQPGTPEAAAMGERYMRAMSDAVAKSQSFTFDTSERLESSPVRGDKKVVNFTRKVTVRRPNALFFEVHGTGETALDIAAYYDGRTLTLSQKPSGPWAQTTVPGTLDEMMDDVADRFGLPVPVGDVIYSSPYDAFIGSSTKGGFVGRETIEGVPCVKLEYADEWVQVMIWLPDSGPTLPRRIALVYKKSPTPLTAELTLTNWNLEASIPDAAFAFQPPPGSVPGDFESFTERLLSRLVPAASPAVAEVKTAGEPAAR